ncbi:MAG: hypothetical protein K0U93_06240 [Gammaproteobacteria bacterium]|nr:hypothetical protein [Gammaproteobacteria bacterium]
MTQRFLHACFEFFVWFLSSWWELLTRHRELLSSSNRMAWILANIEAVAVLLITILSLILLINVIQDPSLVFQFQNPRVSR